MLFFRQVAALCVKNWIVLAKHPFVNLFRCLLAPIAIAILLGYAQFFITKPDVDGFGSMVPVASLADKFDPALRIPWVDLTNSNSSSSTTPQVIMERVTRGFSSKQLASTQKVDLDDLAELCLQNPNGQSKCFASVVFDQIPAAGSDGTFNYTIRVNSGIGHIDVKSHNSDYERIVLPLQWAVESAIIEITTGVTPDTPLEWPYTFASPNNTKDDVRIAYLNWIALLLIPFFACIIDVAYHLPAKATAERAIGLTSHMKAMGLLDSARVVSWHLSMSLAYLPSWIIIAGVWKATLFTATNFGLVFIILILSGLSLTSWSMFVMAPFGKSPALAAITTTLFSLIPVVIGMFFGFISAGNAAPLVLFFPTFFLPFALQVLAGFEQSLEPASATRTPPVEAPLFWPLIVAVVFSIFLWPTVGAIIERYRFDAPNPAGTFSAFTGKSAKSQDPPPPGAAISIRDLNKSFYTSVFRTKKSLVTAISDLTLDIPKNGIFVLLGPNGAGKSTLMSVLGGLTGATRGSVVFAGGTLRPPLGSVGIVPQKNVLFPELTCRQTVKVWSAIKPRAAAAEEEEIVQVLRDCDLADKLDYMADALSGGQKRKLQLAIGLVGGSEIILVDEATSGVDPLSRRAIWKTLGAVRNDKTIIFTTHFLDEADLLADDIAVLDTPGKLVAHGSPISLKTTRGDGYKLRVTFLPSTEKTGIPDRELLQIVKRNAPQAYFSVTGPSERVYNLKTSHLATVKEVLESVAKEKANLQISTYAVSAASIEDIFLELMHQGEAAAAQSSSGVAREGSDADSALDLPELPSAPEKLELSNGTQRTIFGQALTIFYKRLLILRRSWLSPFLAVAFIMVTCTIPFIYVSREGNACGIILNSIQFSEPFFLPDSSFGIFDPQDLLVTPPGVLTALGNATGSLAVSSNATNNATFVKLIGPDPVYGSASYSGGLSIDLDSGAALVAWAADTGGGRAGPILLNAASNLLLNRALNNTGRALSNGSPVLISLKLGNFAEKSLGDQSPLQWAAVFGAAMGVLPAFFTLYVARERRSSVQAMQFSNGISNPAGLWLGHLMFDSMFTTFTATLLAIVFAAKWAELFHGLGYLWFCMVLYGIASNLFAYCVTFFIKSPVGAWAALAVFHILLFLFYLMGYLLTTTYAEVQDADRDLNAIHFTLSLISPLPSIVRAGFVAVNLFSLVCVGNSELGPSTLGSITRYGGPILYLIVWIIVLFGILTYADSGSPLRQFFLRLRKNPAKRASSRPDVEAEAAAAVANANDALRVLDVSKSFGKGRVVDDVTFGVGKDTIFALLGPNGAGKTTTFNMIRGELILDEGEVFVGNHSVVRNTQAARLELGVCPQFTAIDAQLSVREHLHLYARLKGLPLDEVRSNADRVMRATGLNAYADRLANKLSGGNQRKLALAIALLGNPSVVLIDEFSTGVDAKMKREMWSVLKNVAPGKAIVITTHSMEEASTLASKVGIISRRMLAVDSTEALMYHVHFPGRSREEITRAQEIMARVPGARIADDIATRFEVPIGKGGMTLAGLFGILAEAGASEYAVEEANLESVFMQVIRENDVKGVDGRGSSEKRSWWRF